MEEPREWDQFRTLHAAVAKEAVATLNAVVSLEEEVVPATGTSRVAPVTEPIPRPHPLLVVARHAKGFPEALLEIVR